MEIQKQTVYFAEKETPILTHHLDGYNKKEGYFFTTEQLNRFLSLVIKDTLNTAAKKALCDFDEGGCTEFVDEKSITNTFEETFNKHKI
jgi:hypothetical protein